MQASIEQAHSQTVKKCLGVALSSFDAKFKVLSSLTSCLEIIVNK